MYDYVSALQSAKEFLREEPASTAERAALYAAVAQIADQIENTPGERNPYLGEQMVRLRTHAGRVFGIDTGGPSHTSPVSDALGAINVAIDLLEEMD